MLLNIVNEINTKYDGAIAFVFENKELELAKEFEEYLPFIKKSCKKLNFTGKAKEKINLNLNINEEPFELTLVALGSEEKLNSFDFRNYLFSALGQAKAKNKIIFSKNVRYKSALLETILISDYKFNKYKSKEDEKKTTEDEKELRVDFYDNFSSDLIEEAEYIVNGIKITRDLVNEPANVIYPESLANKAIDLGKENGFKVEVFGDEEIEKLGMTAFLEVARAAQARPKLIVMRYMGGGENEEILALVGKGLTYDTGGLSLKPSNSMDTMKCDMAGAGTVIGAMTAIAKMKIKKNVIAIIAACENSIGANAYRPGDIIKSMSGKTIEVLNTDAEGRLTLIDAIHYAIEIEKADKIIDIATLTGAVLVALGETTTGALSNNDEFYNSFEKAARESDERLWRLPNFPEYGKLLESKIADLKNIGGKWGGTISAGMFLEKFVQDKPWIHLDIAGSAWADTAYSYYTPGGTGQMLRSLVYFLKNNS